MSFFDKKNAIDAASKKRKGGKAAAGMAAAAVVAGGAVIASEAGAATIENVASYVINDDGSITVTYLDGSTATYAAGSYTIDGGQVAMVDGGVLLAGGAVGLAALMVAAFANGETTAATLAPAAATHGNDTFTTIGGTTTDGDAADDGAASNFVEAGDTNDNGDAVLSPVLASGPSYSVSAADIPDGVYEVEIPSDAVLLELEGDDAITLVDLDNPAADVTVSNLDGGDRVEIASDADLNTVTLELESGAEQDNPLIVSLEGVTVTDTPSVGFLEVTNGAEAVRIEATGDDASSLDELRADDAELLQLAGDQALTLENIDAAALTTIDATQADGGVTIGEYNDTAPAAFTGFVDLSAMTDYDGSAAADLLGIGDDISPNSLGENANIDLAGGDDIIEFYDVGDGVELRGDVTISAGSGSDSVDLAGVDLVANTASLTVDLGAADGSEDVLRFNDISTGDDNELTVQNFEAGTDKLHFGSTGVTPDVDGDASPDDDTVGVVDSDSTGTDVELEFALNIISDALTVDDLTASADVLDALAADYDFAGNGAKVYVMVNDGTDAALYLLEGDTGNADIVATDDDATLVAVFEDTPDMTGLADVAGSSFVDFA